MRGRRKTRTVGVYRRATALAVTVVSLATLLGFAALAIDIGRLYNVRTELQRTADAAALGGAQKLLDNSALKGKPELGGVELAVREQARAVALLNPVHNAGPRLAAADVKLGYLADPYDTSESVNFSSPAKYNAVQVTVRRDGTMNGPISLTFARIFGLNSASVTASATASFVEGVKGFHVTQKTGNAQLLPFALHVDAWDALLAGKGSAKDNYAYDERADAVGPGTDGILELNLYPGSGGSQLTPGNFGMVNIGPSSNSTSRVRDQILYGVTEEDLSYLGGSLEFGPDGTITLSGSTDFTVNGDTGLSAAIEKPLNTIAGKTRIIPLFNKVAQPGNNATFTIVGFAGIRIMDSNLNGALKNKKIIVQPAYVLDNSIISGSTSGQSYFVYQSVALCR